MKTFTSGALIGAALWLAGNSLPGSGRLEAAPNDGGGLQFLHGTVVTDSGKSYTGALRWGGEEAFWDDLFNGVKQDLPYIDRQPDDERPRHQIKILGVLPIGFWEEDERGRQFAARFGDIKEIRPLGGDRVEVVMKSGTKYRLDGGSNDIGADIHLDDAEVGAIDLSWDKIERVTLEPAKARAAEPKASRLFGEVGTEAGTFTGFIQWDSQECLSTDRLEGDSEDGKVSLEMGRIRSIEKNGRKGARVETKDGRKLDLHGTNDVDDSIRGILVEDARYGRVKVSWEAFRRIEFRDTPGASRSYGDYQPTQPLRGSVTDRDGKKWQGKIVFDLDESESWEMLDGARQGVEYSVPFERIRSLEPRDALGTTVTLRNGQKLQLEGSQDVSEKNSGVLVMRAAGESEHYVPWERVGRIDFD